MHVLVTGGTGDIGTAVVTRLISEGVTVRVYSADDRNHIDGAEYVHGDILDFASLQSATEGCDAVAHLAAIRGPGLAPPEKLFNVNVSGTFNVYQAAACTGVGRVVSASSINAAGYFYGRRDFMPGVFPIVESHENYTTDAYSFSKETLESIGAYFWRRERISGTNLRFPWVYLSNEKARSAVRQRIAGAREYYRGLFEGSEAEQAAFRATLDAKITAFREAHGHERKGAASDRFERGELDAFIDSRNFFTTCDVRDTALAVYRSLAATYSGVHPLYINDTVNFLGLPSKKLISLFFPHARIEPEELERDESLVSTARARSIIGYEPEHPVSELWP